MLFGNVHTGLGVRRRVANRIVMVVSRWVWVVGLRRCARGKCMQRVANRIVKVVSRRVWVVGLRRCAFNRNVLRKCQKKKIYIGK